MPERVPTPALSMMPSDLATTVVGIDCATDPRRVGPARGRHRSGRVEVDEARMGTRTSPPADVVSDWIGTADGPVLLALDAPLGWPAPLGDALVEHRAGDEIGVDAHRLFRQATDRAVRDRLGKQSLDVGAERTAHAALGLLGTLRQRLGIDLPLAWEPTVVGVQSAEAYPAATLRAYGIDATGYKKPSREDARARVLRDLDPYLDVPASPLLRQRDDAIDAVLCLLAGADILNGTAVPPADRALAEREGWIWVRDLPA